MHSIKLLWNLSLLLSNSSLRNGNLKYEQHSRIISLFTVLNTPLGIVRQQSLTISKNFLAKFNILVHTTSMVYICFFSPAQGSPPLMLACQLFNTCMYLYILVLKPIFSSKRDVTQSGVLVGIPGRGVTDLASHSAFVASRYSAHWLTEADQMDLILSRRASFSWLNHQIKQFLIESGRRILPTQPHVGPGDFWVTCAVAQSTRREQDVRRTSKRSH